MLVKVSVPVCKDCDPSFALIDPEDVAAVIPARATTWAVYFKSIDVVVVIDSEADANKLMVHFDEL